MGTLARNEFKERLRAAEVCEIFQNNFSAEQLWKPQKHSGLIPFLVKLQHKPKLFRLQETPPRKFTWKLSEVLGLSKSQLPRLASSSCTLNCDKIVKQNNYNSKYNLDIFRTGFSLPAWAYHQDRKPECIPQTDLSNVL